MSPIFRSLTILGLGLVWLVAPPVTLHAQNPITAAREAFRKAQEEARRKAQQGQQAPAPGQAAGAPAAGQPANRGPAAAPGSAPSAPATVERTAALATAATFVDVAGLKLGMPIDRLAAAVRAINPELKPEPPNMVVVWPYDPTDTGLPAPADAPRSLQDAEFRATNGRGITEVVQVRAALYPNAPVLTHIERKVVYETNKGPSIDVVVEGLREKYGRESVVVGDIKSQVVQTLQLRWIFEGAPPALQGNLATRLRTCPVGGMAGDGSPCGPLTVLDASLLATGNGSVTEFTVRAASNPLLDTSAAVTDAYLRQVAEARAQRQQRDSQQRPKPKL